LALVPAAGCNRKPAVPAGGAAPATAPQVSVVKPEMRPIKRVVEQPGAVAAFEETALHANLTGYVEAVADDPNKKGRPPHDQFIDIDSRVKNDQVLARLSVPELAEELKQKESLVEQAVAEVAQAEKAHAAAGAAVAAAVAMVAESDASVEKAEALYERWQREYDRVVKLVGSGMTDLQTRDETQFQVKAAEATRKEALARVATAKAAVAKSKADEDKAAADVKAAAARLDVAKAAVREVKARQGYLEIKAPFDGVVTRRSVNRGALVKSGDNHVLFSVARIDPVRVVIHVPEADAGLVAAGQDVRMALQGPEQTGKVVRTSWSLEPGSRTLRTEIDLPNDKGLLRPGMYVHAKLTAELPAAWAVPAAAVGKLGDDAILYLVENGKAVRVVAQLLKGDGQFTQISRYRKPGASDWTDMTGTESFATPAAAVTDGQTVP
ncbi:MAG TPA: efflux RND transporter periplasmic adaptor subunit, partial [Gemmata sp.]|nr:efflux RND transporter periplasmic adaptor subunit [Gemmata sp.]